MPQERFFLLTGGSIKFFVLWNVRGKDSTAWQTFSFQQALIRDQVADNTELARLSGEIQHNNEEQEKLACVGDNQ